jgi:hypothetical protein
MDWDTLCIYHIGGTCFDDSYIRRPIPLGEYPGTAACQKVPQLYMWYVDIRSKSNCLITNSSGWLNALGWGGAIAATSFFTSSMTQALIVQTHPDYDPKGWQGTLLMWAVLLLVLFFNTALSKTLPAIEVCILIIHLLGFFAILIPILYLSPKENAGAVFTTFNNLGGWSSQGLSWFVGLSGNAAAFVGKFI